MKVVDHIRNAKDTVFSIEILPPLKGQDINSLFRGIEPLMEFKPPFIDVTYHREDYVYKKRENGVVEKVSVYKRPGTVAISAAIMNRFKVDAVPHIICGGFSKEETENALIELNFLGIDNVLALRGDPIKAEGRFIPEHNGNAYATDLIQQISNLNKGIYVEDDILNASCTNFCIGIAAYPEKHYEAVSFDSDLQYLKQKVELGAEYIVTQLFYDNSKFFAFEKKCKEMGINIPIIPGLKPLSTRKQLSILPSIFYVNMPDALVKAVNDCTTDEQVRQVGIEWCIQQSKELKAAGVPVLHYYTMGKSEAVYAIAKELF
ncbi:MAG: metF [Cytophagaceae bacterium]|jgi:methylenetetrahydrofolate reductase (NADPH)|nr:metF [Cytophagaceae bacterium]